MSNSDHTRWGTEFQYSVLEWFGHHYTDEFSTEVSIPVGVVGAEKKDHKYDIANKDHSIVIECKRYNWTETGNVPSAKIRSLNEAVFYLHLLDNSCYKVLAMVKASHPKQIQTLAEYYVRTNHNLIGDVIIAEYDPDSEKMRFINGQGVESNSCHVFQMDNPSQALNEMKLEKIIDYGSQANGVIYHTWDSGVRWLGRCKKCGGLVLVQDSEYHGQEDDDYYTDYFPIYSANEAQSYNLRLNGFEIEKKFPGRFLMQTNNHPAHWST